MPDVMAPEVPSYHLFTQPTDEKTVAQRSRAWRGDEFTFSDFLDIINPLQHLPVVSTIYRYITGEPIGAVPRIIGDSIFGGPLGLIAGIANATLKQESGKDSGEQLLAMVTGNDAIGDAPPAVYAEKNTPPAPSAAPVAAKADIAAAPAYAGASPVTGATVQPGSGPIAPAQRQVAAAPPGGLPLAKAAVTDSDPRSPFLAHVEQMRRQASSPLSNRVIPLDGVAAPLAQGRQRGVSTVPTGAPSTGDPTPIPATPAPQSSAALPTNPPINISQQMMDALDKYARMQQQRGQQLDLAQ